MANLAVTQHSRLADRIMGAYFRLSVEEGTFREDTAPFFSHDTLALCGLFNMTPVKLHYAGADRRLQCEAFIVNDPADRRIYLTNHAKSPERALIGHELVHRMRRERPKLYDSLVRALGDAGEAHDRWIAYYTAMREQTQRKEGRALSDDEIREEGVADLVGDLILDPAVWRALRQPTLLQRVADWIGSVWKRLRRAQTPVDPLGGGGLIRDRKRAMAAVARVLGDWADSLARPSPADPDYAPAPANATLRRDPNAPAGAFRSALLDALVAGKGAPVQALWQQWLGWLDGAQRRGEFRQSERAWLGLDAWMGQWKGPIPRQALVDYLHAHQVLIEEVVLGESDVADVEAWWSDEGGANEDTPWGDLTAAEQAEARDRYRDEVGQYKEQGTTAKFASYQLPGGENYRELLLTMPPRLGASDRLTQLENDRLVRGLSEDEWSELRALRGDSRREPGVVPTDGTFRSSHWGQPNVLAHVRFNERTDADGKRVLFIEEIQSDWHQAGRKQGYAGDKGPARAILNGSYWRVEDRGGALLTEVHNTVAKTAQDAIEHARRLIAQNGLIGGKGVPDAPFKATDEWAMLAFKRMVRHAAENGFDRIAWTTGEQQAERYDLSKQVSVIDVSAVASGHYVTIHPIGGEPISLFSNEDGLVSSPAEFAGKQLDSVVGKDITDRILSANGNERLEGGDLKVGGSGMRAFYDKILPSAVNKWAKKFGGRVGRVTIENAGVDDIMVSRRGAGWAVIDGGTDTVLSEHATNAGALVEANRAGAQKRMETTVPVVVHALDLTEAMRDAALAGLPLFKRAAIIPTVEPDPCEAPYSFVP